MGMSKPDAESSGKDPVRRIESLLTRHAAQMWPGAVVYRETDGSFTLERPRREALGLGMNFGRAREALSEIRLVEYQRRKPF
jgi:hypothetical protein